MFRHFQRLDVAFHDRYTSGRVVSRLTNDVEAIQELLSNGFDGLVTAALTLVGTAVLLLTLDLKLGLACLVGFPVAAAARAVVPQRLGVDLPHRPGERRRWSSSTSWRR